MSIRLTTMASTGLALEDQTGGILLVHADAQRMGLDARTGAGKARADLEHVCAEAVFLTLDKMIGIVLHEAGRAIAALAHGLQDGGHGGDLPVALAAVAIALRHQVLGLARPGSCSMP